MVVAITVTLIAVVTWIVAALAAGIGLGRIMARSESEDGRVPSLVSGNAKNTVASL
ncbi:MAG: hypothetical protein K0S37_1303 [Microbacterium sp.]|jgi:hypothetical protein|nr:hypothetical protein [Microbacterium sp.]